jgi:hypothetical protein
MPWGIRPQDKIQYNILLLGCGDPRNVFLLAGLIVNPDQQLRPTMCDIDQPTIFARNIILFKRVLGCKPFDKI